MLFLKLVRNCLILVFLLSGILVFFYFSYQQIDKNIDKVTRINRMVHNRKLNYESTVTSRSPLVNILKCKNIPLEMQRIKYGKYWLLKNYVIGSKSRNIGCADTITMATNGEYRFSKHLPQLVKRWLAPVSFALYAPGHDFIHTLSSIQYVRNCLPESVLIQKYVTFHIYFPEKHLPASIPRSENEALKWNQYDCNLAPYETTNKITYRRLMNLTYPINVGRNIARKAVNTYFVLTNDIELYPSPGIIDKFLRMIKRNTSLVENEPGKRRVFPLNVYELKANVNLPNNKEELKKLLKAKQAFVFHQKLCFYCHNYPLTREWLKIKSVNETSVIGIRKRQGFQKRWEPFYISDNKEPIFDERVTWEGQKNKRIQAYAMCLLDYDFYILDDGFLVHSPGIKKKINHDHRPRYTISTHYLIFNKILYEYRKLYGINGYCVI